MSFRNHYNTLGVSKKATQDEIKAAFRKLSLETHPDLNKENDGEAFKAIAEAHSILSSPTERMKYDRQLQDASMWRRPGARGGYYDSGNIPRPGTRNPSGLHVAMETLSNPRYIIFGLVAFGSFAAILGNFTSKRPQVQLHHSSPTVFAWKNPNTNEWEQPAPWDPLYRKLNPKLELVPREKVKRRNMER